MWWPVLSWFPLLVFYLTRHLWKSNDKDSSICYFSSAWHWNQWAAGAVPLSTLSEMIITLDRACHPIARRTHSFLKAFSRLLPEWPWVEVRDKDCAIKGCSVSLERGDSHRVWDDINCLQSRPLGHFHPLSLRHVTCKNCPCGSGNPDLF